ncbi:hypothetical protein ACIREO_22165 [Streptomyces sp. NPDC102441]|uniref:hypothetical protein n=1 Tax=Streptomyces sp. NPDC102441 TaxID=3366176 RepID=UPI0038143671
MLALYGGWMRINWFDLGGADSMGAGHSLWEVSAHQVREASRWSAVAGTGGVRDEGPTNPGAAPVLPLPPEVKRKAAAEARR